MPGRGETARAVLALLRLDARRFFAEARHLLFVPIVIAGLPFALAYQVPSPLIPAAAVGLILAERWIMDMFDKKGRAVVKLSAYPVPWESIVLSKQVVAIAVAVGGAAVAALIYSWFHPAPPSWAEALRGSLAYLCVVLPVVQAGSAASVAELQDEVQTPVDSLVRAIMNLVFAAFACIPVLLLLSLSDPLLPLVLYLGLVSALWYAFGVRAVAHRIRRWQASPDYNV